jgi:hypothetical protein
MIGRISAPTIAATVALALFLLGATTTVHAVDKATDIAADPVATEDTAAIQKVISEQMAAFRDDDWSRAFSYATPTIQSKFGDIETFKRMVISGYPSVYRPRDVSFEKIEDLDGVIAQHVRVVGPDDKAKIAVYVMEKQDSGVWRIAGVYLIEVPDQMV